MSAAALWIAAAGELQLHWAELQREMMCQGVQGKTASDSVPRCLLIFQG